MGCVRVEKGTRDGEMGRRIGNGTGGGGGEWEEGVVSGALGSGELESEEWEIEEWESGEWGGGKREAAEVDYSCNTHLLSASPITPNPTPPIPYHLSPLLPSPQKKLPSYETSPIPSPSRPDNVKLTHRLNHPSAFSPLGGYSNPPFPSVPSPPTPCTPFEPGSRHSNFGVQVHHSDWG